MLLLLFYLIFILILLKLRAGALQCVTEINHHGLSGLDLLKKLVCHVFLSLISTFFFIHVICELYSYLGMKVLWECIGRDILQITYFWSSLFWACKKFLYQILLWIETGYFYHYLLYLKRYTFQHFCCLKCPNFDMP